MKPLVGNFDSSNSKVRFPDIMDTSSNSQHSAGKKRREQPVQLEMGGNLPPTIYVPIRNGKQNKQVN
jgi:hypothetical protein